MPEEKTAEGTGNQSAAKRPSDKYGDDTSKLREGYDNQFTETQKIIGRLSKIEAENNALKAILQVGSVAEQRGGDRSVSTKPSAREALAAAEVPVDSIEQLVAEQVGLALKPLAEGMAAEQTLESTYPGFSGSKGEMVQFLRSDPELWDRYSREVVRNPLTTMEWGYLKFQQSRGTLAARESASGAKENAEARKDSELTGGSGGGSRKTADEGEVERLRAAAKQAMEGGGIDAFVAERIGNIPSVKKVTEGRE